MPIYDYVCDRGHRFELIHGIHDAGPTECPVCGSTSVRKAFVPPAIHFKGSGWAKKDRSASSKTGAAAKEPKPSDTPAAASDGGGGDGSSTATTTSNEPASKPKTPAKASDD